MVRMVETLKALYRMALVVMHATLLI